MKTKKSKKRKEMRRKRSEPQRLPSRFSQRTTSKMKIAFKLMTSISKTIMRSKSMIKNKNYKMKLKVNVIFRKKLKLTLYPKMMMLRIIR